MVVLSVRFDLTVDELTGFSPTLAGKRAPSWSDEPAIVISEIQQRLELLPEEPAGGTWTTTERRVESGISTKSPIDSAVELAKHYLTENNRIGLHELMASNLRSANTQIGDWPFGGNREKLVALVERIDSATETAINLVATYAFYGDSSTDRLWIPTLKEWARQPSVGGTTVFIDLLFYPATRLMYAAGVSMIAASRLLDTEQLLRETITVHTSGKQGPFSSELHARRSLSGLVERTPVDVTSDHVFRLLAPQIEERLLLSPQAIEDAYEQFELLLFLVSIDSRAAGLDASNLSMGRIRSGGSMLAPRARLVSELENIAQTDSHPWIDAGLFDSDLDRLQGLIRDFDGYFAATHPGLFR